MGYDMYFVTAPDGETERIAAAREKIDAAVAQRDQAGDNTEQHEKAQDAIGAAVRELETARTAYFRLNIWGMSRYRSAMFDLGMGYDSESPREWPEAASDRVRDLSYELENDRQYWPEAVTDDEVTAARTHRDQVKAHLKLHPEGGDTIPLHKFGSNDGWIVTPEEITAALAAYDAHTDPSAALASAGIDEREYWDQWIAWLRRAVDHGGFEVF